MWFPVQMDEAGLRAIANPRRREILRLVWDQERSSGDIASHFNVSWPAISQNLRVLEEVGFVRSRRCRQTRLYRADQARLGPLKRVLTSMWETDLDRLAGLAEAEADTGRSKK
jgi:DNA-binding transcriptional ArsR family regulator